MTLCACPADSRNSNTTPSIPNLNDFTNAPESARARSSSKHKRDSKISVFTSDSARSHKEYLDNLEAPTREIIQRIGEVQEQKEVEIIKKRLSLQPNGDEMNDNERQKAAELIQRSYRGHRERRMLNGMSLDPSTRWVEAVKEARYRHITEPRSRETNELARPSMDGNAQSSTSPGGTTSAARQNWKKIGLITRRAGADEDSDDSGSDVEAADAHGREERLKRKHEAKLERQKAAKIMDLQYFLEMVDLKHRYGSNLRTYHEEWKKSDTHENFFYWLDYGEGRFIDCQGCPRERLDRECVRYLSKEERLDYLVKIDKEVRLCWAKNGVRIDTTEQYKDSIHSIVPADDNTPAFAMLAKRQPLALRMTVAAAPRVHVNRKGIAQINIPRRNSTTRKGSRESGMCQQLLSSTSCSEAPSKRTPGYL